MYIDAEFLSSSVDPLYTVKYTRVLLHSRRGENFCIIRALARAGGKTATKALVYIATTSAHLWKIHRIGILAGAERVMRFPLVPVPLVREGNNCKKPLYGSLQSGPPFARFSLALSKTPLSSDDPRFRAIYV